MYVPFRLVNPRTGGVSPQGTALVDTGSSQTIVDNSFVASFQATGGHEILTPAFGPPQTDLVYVADLDLGTHGYAANTKIVAQDMGIPGLQGLIGYDVLSKGLLVVDGPVDTWYLRVGMPQAQTQGTNGLMVVSIAGIVFGGTVLILAARDTVRSRR